MTKSFKLFLAGIFLLGVFLRNSTLVLADEWYQDAHDAQRTGYTPEEPVEPWSFLWAWNGPDASGGSGGHFYDVGSSQDHGGTSPMWEGRTVTGGDFIYVPALEHGLYALRKSNGSQAWNFSPGGSMKATPAYDSATGHVYVGSSNGRLYKINAANGSQAGVYDAGGNGLNKSVLLAAGAVFVVTDSGDLLKINKGSMAREWIYSGNAGGYGVGTPPAYSASANLVVYATNDLYVHAVNASSGSQVWRAKPTNNSPGFPYEFDGQWPVIADQHRLVFVRMRLEQNALNGPTGGHFPNSNAETRTYLDNNPGRKNLFALDLSSGGERFTPAVGYQSVEALINGGPYGDIGPVPVIKNIGGQEVAYQTFRSGQNNPSNHTRDTHMGEMVLENTPDFGLVAGDLRFVQAHRTMVENNFALADAVGTVSMAGNTWFHSGWGAVSSAQITDRSSSRGLTFSNPISTARRPTIIRRIESWGESPRADHWVNRGTLTLYRDGSPFDGPGFWAYWDTMDPPTPIRGAYSEGILPRYTYVADGLVVNEGNGGELMVFRHSGSSPPPITPTSQPTVPPATPTSTPTFKKGDINQDGQVNAVDALAVLTAWLSGGTTQYQYREDINDDGKVNGMDFNHVIKDWNP